MTTKIALYRHFDAAGRLLYVGISLCAFQRTREHGRTKPWFQDVVRIDIEWHNTRSQAEAAEYQAIKLERPLHNRAFRAKTPAPAEPILVLNGAQRVVSGVDITRQANSNDARMIRQFIRGLE